MCVFVCVEIVPERYTKYTIATSRVAPVLVRNLTVDFSLSLVLSLPFFLHPLPRDQTTFLTDFG